MEKIIVTFKNQWRSGQHYINLFDINMAIHYWQKDKVCFCTKNAIFIWFILLGYQVRIRININKK